MQLTHATSGNSNSSESFASDLLSHSTSSATLISSFSSSSSFSPKFSIPSFKSLETMPHQMDPTILKPLRSLGSLNSLIETPASPPESLVSSSSIEDSPSPRSLHQSRQSSFTEFTLDPMLKRRFSDSENTDAATLSSSHYHRDIILRPKKSRIIKKSNTYKKQPTLDLLSLISIKGDNNDSLSKFLQSEKTYSLLQPLTAESLENLLDNIYGGRVVVSRKRKSFGLEDKLSDLDTTFDQSLSQQHQQQEQQKISQTSPQLSNLSPIASPEIKKKKQPQGRPYSSEMVIDAIFPQTLDELYSFLCVKGTPPMSHRVKLQNLESKDDQNNTTEHEGRLDTSATQSVPQYQQYPPLDEQGCPIFSNSLDMIKYFTGAHAFSIVTAFRQSSVDKSPFKKGTCPVVKFNISPVNDYSIEYLKRMAYPRYKAGMKMYIIPQQFANVSLPSSAISPVAASTSTPDSPASTPAAVPAAATTTPRTFYTSAAMYLQDQHWRLQNGLDLDLRSRIFHSNVYPDIPGVIYDKDLYQCGPDTKTDLNYILN